MPPRPRTKCGKNPTGTPYTCLRTGIAIGRNTIEKIEMTLSKDILRDIAKRNGIVNYSKKTKQELFDALLAKGVKTYKPIELGK